jgi:hypothetical protein
MKPKDIKFDGKHPELNSNPSQFHLGILTEKENQNLRDLQSLDTANDMIDPEPDDHI